jgi:glucan phosphoethanolaminetransferase (alkaline phosphatase superfamily)
MDLKELQIKIIEKISFFLSSLGVAGFFILLAILGYGLFAGSWFIIKILLIFSIVYGIAILIGKHYGKNLTPDSTLVNIVTKIVKWWTDKRQNVENVVKDKIDDITDDIANKIVDKNNK